MLRVTDGCRVLVRFEISAVRFVPCRASPRSPPHLSPRRRCQPCGDTETEPRGYFRSGLLSGARLAAQLQRLAFLRRGTTNEAENHYSHSRNMIQILVF